MIVSLTAIGSTRRWIGAICRHDKTSMPMLLGNLTDSKYGRIVIELGSYPFVKHGCLAPMQLSLK